MLSVYNERVNFKKQDRTVLDELLTRKYGNMAVRLSDAEYLVEDNSIVGDPYDVFDQIMSQFYNSIVSVRLLYNVFTLRNGVYVINV